MLTFQTQYNWEPTTQENYWDRRWSWSCDKQGSYDGANDTMDPYSNHTWHEWVNYLKDGFEFKCAQDEIITGVHSV